MWCIPWGSKLKLIFLWFLKSFSSQLCFSCIVELMHAINLLILNCFTSAYVFVEVNGWFFDLIYCVWVLDGDRKWRLFKISWILADCYCCLICSICIFNYLLLFSVFKYIAIWLFDPGRWGCFFLLSVIHRCFVSYVKVVPLFLYKPQ